MGMFLSLSGIIGKTHSEVAQSLTNYTKLEGGGLQSGNLDAEQNDLCVVLEADGNTTVLYPSSFLDWDKSSEFISKELNASVFSFHIHDGDLWMYVLYADGIIVDQFNPIPDYWDENMSQEELDSWKGNALTVEKYVPELKHESIRKYIVRWDLDSEDQKAYEDDNFVNEDWQLLDFMDKIGLPFPLDVNGKPLGAVYHLWTKDLRLKDVTQAPQKSWWKFWQ